MLSLLFRSLTNQVDLAKFAVAATRKHPVELRERAVRWCRESDPKPVIAQLARELNVHAEPLRNWIRQDD